MLTTGFEAHHQRLATRTYVFGPRKYFIHTSNFPSKRTRIFEWFCERSMHSYND